MTVKKSSTPSGKYDSSFTGDPEKILTQHGDKNLLNEIELLRYMNLVILQKMNSNRRKLTFYDYLSTLRILTYSAGRIAYLVDVQYRVFSHRVLLEQEHKQQMDSINDRITELAELLMGKERVAEIQFEAMTKMIQEGIKVRE